MNAEKIKHILDNGNNIADSFLQKARAVMETADDEMKKALAKSIAKHEKKSNAADAEEASDKDQSAKSETAKDKA